MSNYNTRDHYFDKAKAQGFKARSVFKLEEIDGSLNLIKPDSLILDLGCAPGSWLQYIAKKLKSGAALGVDLTAVKEKFHPRIKTVVDDCFVLTEEKVRENLKDLVSDFNKFDLIISDMAPSTSGIKHLDQARSLALAEQVLNLCEKLLKTDGNVVIKVFGGGEVPELVNRMKKSFATVKQLRPKSVRSRSKEFYVAGMRKN